MIAACIPSRGLVHSRTIEGVLREKPDMVFVTHDLPIPDCFNNLRERVLESKAEKVWFVEEDMLLPEGILSRLDIGPFVGTDYKGPGGGSTVIRRDGEVIACGTGCLLLDREVLERLGEFRTSVTYDYELQPLEQPATFGGHEIDYCIRARELGYEIQIVEEVGHLRVKEMGPHFGNHGFHRIEAI